MESRIYVMLNSKKLAHINYWNKIVTRKNKDCSRRIFIFFLNWLNSYKFQVSYIFLAPWDKPTICLFIAFLFPCYLLIILIIFSMKYPDINLLCTLISLSSYPFGIYMKFFVILSCHFTLWTCEFFHWVLFSARSLSTWWSRHGLVVSIFH